MCSYKVGKPLPKGQPALPWQKGQQANSTAPVVPLSREDFVAAIVTDEVHEKLAQTGRAWRQASHLSLAWHTQFPSFPGPLTHMWNLQSGT